MQGTGKGQIPLGLVLDDEARFDNFIVNESNRLLIERLCEAQLSGRKILLWGRGTGISHLLQACCNQHRHAVAGAIYIPLGQKDTLSPELLTGIESMSLVCLDDLGAICGDKTWETALFNAFNRISESQSALILGSSLPPAELSFDLPDLSSRMRSTEIYQLSGLTDEEKKTALILRAGGRGLKLSAQVADYLLARVDRSMKSLMRILDLIDLNSLVQQRKITVPLVRELLDSNPELQGRLEMSTILADVDNKPAEDNDTEQGLDQAKQ